MSSFTASFLLFLATAGTALAGEPTIQELLDATDDVNRHASSIADVSMHVKTARIDRTVSMRIKTLGTEHSLIVITAPARDKGIATLKKGDNIWNYMPNIDRTLKVPSSMMSGSWMGSHFTNDDLVRENRLAEQFDAQFTGKPGDDPEGLWVIELVPKPGVPIVWGKVVVRVRADRLPKDIRYLDRRGRLVRTLVYEDIREFDGERVPAVMRVIPAGKPDEFTEVRFDSLAFDVDLTEAEFSQQALRR